MSWNDLSMKDRSSYIRMGVENGITDLDTIRGIYNKFAEGGGLYNKFAEGGKKATRYRSSSNIRKQILHLIEWILCLIKCFLKVL